VLGVSATPHMPLPGVRADSEPTEGRSSPRRHAHSDCYKLGCQGWFVCNGGLVDLRLVVVDKPVCSPNRSYGYIKVCVHRDSYSESDCNIFCTPIDYVLTPRGQRTVEELNLMEELGYCDHHWCIEGGELVCKRCGMDRELPKAFSLPSPHKYAKNER
jgi:hypothetical protein